MGNFEFENFIGPLEQHCVGYPLQGNYLLAVSSTVATVSNINGFSELNLDQIRAFDKAEVTEVNFGKINAIKVSSFCGPLGRLLGYDLAVPENLRSILAGRLHTASGAVPFYDGRPLIDAANQFFGTIEEPNYTFLPGSHVPAAYKHTYALGPDRLASGFAIGVIKGRNLKFLLEHANRVPPGFPVAEQKKEVEIALARSLADIVSVQGEELEEAFVYTVIKDVPKGSTGCALVMMPYFLAAKNSFNELNQ